MAEKSGNSDKIVCRNKKAINNGNETLCSSLLKRLQKDGDKTHKDVNRYMIKFKEALEKVSEQNIVINGVAGDTSVPNTTPEYEPVDKEKEDQINEELLPKLDDCVVKIAKRRKWLPQDVCVKHLFAYSNHQAAYLSRVRLIVPQEDMSSVTSEVGEVSKFIDCQRLRQPCSDLARLTKNGLRVVERAGHVKRAVEMEAADRDSQTARVVHSPLSFLDNSGSVCVVAAPHGKRKLDSGFGDSSSSSSSSTKLIRHSGVLARDFAVVPLPT